VPARAIHPAFRDGKEQVDHDGVVVVSGVQQSAEEALVLCVRHVRERWIIAEEEPPHAAAALEESTKRKRTGKSACATKKMPG
jgi:hypothetical protein